MLAQTYEPKISFFRFQQMIYIAMEGNYTQHCIFLCMYKKECMYLVLFSTTKLEF
jgi:hypothetical protein